MQYDYEWGEDNELLDIWIQNDIGARVIHIPWQLLAVHLVERVEVVRSSGLFVGWRGESGGGLMTVGHGWRGGIIPLRRRGPILAAFHQIGPVWEGRAPFLLFWATAKKVTAWWNAVKDDARHYLHVLLNNIAEEQRVVSAVPSISASYEAI